MELENQATQWADRSATITKLAAAVSKFQAVLEPVRKEASNPYFNKKYADLSAVWEAIRAPLAENELSILQEPQSVDGKISLTTTLLHSSGEYVRSTLTFPVTRQDPQGYGSAITYARRYALQSVTGIAPEDDDGNAAGTAGQGKPQATRPQVRPANELPPPRDTKPRYYDLAEVPESKRGDAIEFFEQAGARLDLETNLYVSTGKLQGCDKFEVPAPAHTPEVEIVDKATGEIIPESKLKKETRAKIEKLKGATAA